MSSIAERLRELRGATSQAEMAKGIGVPQQAWARYEKGVVAPNAETLAAICRVHACSADWLLGLKEHTGAAVVVNGSGNVVANGVKARASTVANGVHAACKTCPHKKFHEAVLKASK